MNHELFGDTDKYESALRQVIDTIPNDLFCLLKEHYRAPNHTVTWKELADSVGLQEGNDINLRYWRIAKPVALKMNITEPPSSEGEEGWWTCGVCRQGW